MIDTLEIPRGTEAIGGMDWGFNSPGCLGWIACLPDGRMHVIREWKFTEQTDDEIAAGYHQRTKTLGLKMRYVACDPTIFFKDGRNAARGQSRGESLRRAGVPLKPAANAREDGWARLHAWLRIPRGDDGTMIGPPMLTIDETCRYLRRSLPQQQSDPANADDVDTRGDDHGADMLRYAVMSRPSPTILRVAPLRPGMAGAMLEAMRRGTRQVIGADNVA